MNSLGGASIEINHKVENDEEDANPLMIDSGLQNPQSFIVQNNNQSNPNII